VPTPHDRRREAAARGAGQPVTATRHTPEACDPRVRRRLCPTRLPPPPQPFPAASLPGDCQRAMNSVQSSGDPARQLSSKTGDDRLAVRRVSSSSRDRHRRAFCLRSWGSPARHRPCSPVHTSSSKVSASIMLTGIRTASGLHPGEWYHDLSGIHAETVAQTSRSCVVE
jgi:hypothetical protein